MDLDELIEDFRKNAGSGGFILDFDGTLSQIVPHPGDARLVPGASEVLAALQTRYAAVAILTGRRAADIAARVGLPGLRYIGLYGAEEWVDGLVVQPPEADVWKAAAADLATDGLAFLERSGLTGCELELKDMALSMHFRNADDPLAAEKIFGWAQDAALGSRFRVSIGRKVVELRPKGVSKAAAVERLIKDLSLNRAVVSGDDLTDVEAMRRAGEVLGDNALRLGIRSGEEPEGLIEHSDLLVHSSKDLVELLERFI